MTKHLIAAALTGCLVWTASSSPAAADPIYVEVEVAPPQIESYPRTVYEGQPVYYYDGHWYGRRGPRWVYYREEPRPLVVYRSSPEYREYREYAPDARDRRRYQARPARDRYEEHRHHRERDRDRDRGRGRERHDDGHHHHHRD